MPLDPWVDDARRFYIKSNRSSPNDGAESFERILMSVNYDCVEGVNLKSKA